jgi:PST family polysaccharide transporter
MRRSSHMFASIVSTTLYLQTNVLALGLICGEREVALYSVGSRLVAAMQSFSIPITQAVFPRASLLFAERPEEAWALLRRVSFFVLPTLALAGLLLGILAPTVVHLIGGPTYAEAASVVRIMAVVPLLVALATGLSQTIMVNTGLTKPLFRIYVMVGCLNLALMPILVFRFASQGAAAALVVAEALGPILMVTTIWRRRGALGNHGP